MEHKNTHQNKEQSKLPKDSGFEVPKGYFDAIEDQFSIRLRETSFPNRSGFEVPEGYFHSLEDNIISQVMVPTRGKVISLKSRMLKVASIAAVFALLLTTYFSFPKSQTNPTSEEINAWIYENIGEIYTEDILIGFDEVADIDVPFLQTPLENNTIENYLDANDTYILIKESQGLFDEIN